MKNKIIKSSFYIPLRCGTQLATFVYYESKQNLESSKTFPIIWSLDRYHSVCTKNKTENDTGSCVEEIFPKILPWLEELTTAGYIVAFVDTRGSGASFGYNDGAFNSQEISDAFDITDWFSKQNWCNGKIGMFGRSYKGVNQLFIATNPHPNLKTIFPEMAFGDLYSFAYSGGIFHHDFVYKWNKKINDLDVTLAAWGVEQDRELKDLNRARTQHRANRDNYSALISLPFRNSKEPNQAERIYQNRSPLYYTKQISESKLPICHFSGWYDLWVKDSLLMFKNFKNPQRIIIGPWTHGGCQGKEMAKFHLKWYNFYLKNEGKDPLLKDKIQYYTIGEYRQSPWKSANKWPLPEQKLLRLFVSIEDILSLQETCPIGNKINYAVNPHCTSGEKTRWSCGYGSEFQYPDMKENDARSLCFTSKPMDKALEITGHPLVNLWVSYEKMHTDIFVYLEEVYPDGYSQYITEGQLRLSHRKETNAPYETFKLPYYRSCAYDLEKESTKPVLVKIDLYPISYLIPKGNCLRLSICCADKHNAFSLVKDGKITLYTGEDYPSQLIVPQIDTLQPK